MKMRIKMKKLIALIGCFVFAFATIVGNTGIASAETSDEIIETDKTGSITIYVSDQNGADPIEGTGNQVTTDERNNLGNPINDVTFAYKKIADIVSVNGEGDDAGTVTMMYKLTTEAKTALGATKDQYTSDDLNTLLATANKTTLKNAFLALNPAEITTGKDGATASSGTGTIPGKTSVTNLPLGLYLVVEKEHPTNVDVTIDPFFVSVPMTDSVKQETNTWNYDVVVYPKSHTIDDVNLTKTVADATSETTKTFAKTATVCTGDTVSYRIQTTLPEITELAKITYLHELKFNDTLAKGLKYVKDSVKIEIYDKTSATTPVATWDNGSDNFETTFDDDANTMLVNITEAGLEKVNPDYSLYIMRVCYDCTVNSDIDNVVYGDKGNKNEAEISFTRKSEVDADNPENTKVHTADDSTEVYTYGVEIQKNFKGGTGDYTKVQFVLKNTTDNYNITANKASDGVYYVTANTNGATSTILVPDSNGKLTIYGLEENVYELREVQTDKGFSLLKESMYIEVKSTVEEATEETPEETREGSATVKAGANQTAVEVEMHSFGTEDDASANAIVPVTVTNAKAFLLPQTGGMGTILFTIIGAVLFAAAVLFLLKGRKKSEK